MQQSQPRQAAPVTRLLRPMQEFIHQSTASGIILIGTIVLALVLANSPLAPTYQAILHLPIGIGIGAQNLTHDLQHWINDGLMAIFFFLVGLEIKREILVGELADRKAAMLPITVAIGGALIPAGIYWFINRGGPGMQGWAIPMATDIAIALGVLALLGTRVPAVLTIFLTAVAIADDLMAIVVIALFYTASINALALGVGAGLLVLLGIGNKLGIRSTLVYCIIGVGVWLAFEQSGIHATIAGVLVAWTVPARNRLDPAVFLAEMRSTLDAFEARDLEPVRMLTDERQQTALRAIEDHSERVQAPLQKLEHQLHPWVAFGILPIFALANAGIPISVSALDGGAVPTMLGISLGLVLGKPLGFMIAAGIMVRGGWATLPPGVTWRHMLGAGMLAGIGFTMSLFIAALSFTDAALLEAAKLSIVGASLIAGILGYSLLRLTPSSEQHVRADTVP